MPKVFSCNYGDYNIVKCCQNTNFEEVSTKKKMMRFDYCEEYLRSISNKRFYGRVQKSKFSVSCHFQIHKKINNVNKKTFKEKI